MSDVKPALTATEAAKLREIVRQLYLVGIAVEQVGGKEMLAQFFEHLEIIKSGVDGLLRENQELRVLALLPPSDSTRAQDE
jgi:hypothetical protein